jgi:dolichyl-phosphate beta-glucosyltransferase
VAVVNDGSQDRTADLVRAAAVHQPRVRLLQYGVNRGKGYAVRYGMTHVTGELRLFMDADNSTTLDHVAEFFAYFSMGFDVVIGSRDVPGADIAVHQPWWKEKLGDLGNLWIQLLAVPGVKDTQAGFKVFSARAAADVFPRLTLDRWGFDVEALAVARALGYKIAERPIRWVNDTESKVSPRAYLDVLFEVVKVRLNLWRGLYSKSDSPAAS